MKIGILGTRGIPNNYGGFEECAEYLSKGLARIGHEVYVYNSHNHPYQKKSWSNVNIIHKYDPETKIGSAGQFIYDLNCIIDSRKRNFDIILQLGYGTSSLWFWLLPQSSVITTNMDGLEWKRGKYSKKAQKFLKYAEFLGVKYGGHLISDSEEIQRYFQEEYNANSTFLPYGTEVFNSPDKFILEKYNLQPFNYDIQIARFEPENNLEIVLEGISNSDIDRTVIVIGNYNTKYGNYIKNKFTNKKIRFLGSIYDKNILNNFRYFSNIYFHGHSVGGTNPSLLEAMSSSALICSHKNEFNRSVLENNAYYFSTAEELSNLYSIVVKSTNEQIKIQNNLDKVKYFYSHEKIVNDYLSHFIRIKSDNINPENEYRTLVNKQISNDSNNKGAKKYFQ